MRAELLVITEDFEEWKLVRLEALEDELARME